MSTSHRFSSRCALPQQDRVRCSDDGMKYKCDLLCADAKAAADKLALAVSKAGVETLMSVAYPNRWRPS